MTEQSEQPLPPQFQMPGAELQDPMSYDEVIEDLQNEIGRLAVSLRVAQRQNAKNLAKWQRENSEKDRLIAELSSRLAQHEPETQVTLDDVAASVPDTDEQDDPPQEGGILASDLPDDAELVVAPVPAKKRSTRQS